MDILEELNRIRSEEIESNNNNIYVRALSKLLKIERESVYGKKSTGLRSQKIEKVILDELVHYKELCNAAKKN
jgi:hypothetical protein